MNINRETLDAVFAALAAGTTGPWKKVGSMHCNGVGGDFDSTPGAFKLVCGESSGPNCDAIVAAVNWLRENRAALTAPVAAAPDSELHALLANSTPLREAAFRALGFIDRESSGGEESYRHLQKALHDECASTPAAPVGIVSAHRFIATGAPLKLVVWRDGQANDLELQAEREGYGRIEYAYSAPAAPDLDPGLYTWLQERGIAPDSHDGLIEMDEVVEALNEHERQLLARTPAAPGIDPALQIVLTKLHRFAECAEDFDNDGCDIGRDWFDALTTIGLLERTQRSPAIWTMTKAGKALIDASPKGGSAVVAELAAAAEGVLWFDWSDNDSDAVASIERLRNSLNRMQATSAEVGE